MISRNSERGTTLIEVLVTIIILAIGLLGLAGLQVTSLQSNHSSYYRSQATVLAYDISERMRANRTAALAGSYNVNFPDSSSSNAVSGNLASRDSAEWLNALAETLPSGTGRVQINGALVTIHVRWDDTRGGIHKTDGSDPTTTETFIYRTEI